MRGLNFRRINRQVPILAAVLGAAQLFVHPGMAFQQSSYLLFEMVDGEAVATADSRRIPIDRAVFEDPEVTKSDTEKGPDSLSASPLDFSTNTFGSDQSDFGSTFNDFENDTAQLNETESFGRSFFDIEP